MTALGASTSTDSGISSQDSTENDRKDKSENAMEIYLLIRYLILIRSLPLLVGILFLESKPTTQQTLDKMMSKFHLYFEKRLANK